MLDNMTASQWLTQVNPQAYARLNTPITELGREKDSTQLSFAEVINSIQAPAADAIHEARQSQLSLLSGQADSVHAVVLAAEKADIALQLTVTIRNKVIDAYNEIMRMQL